jgi:hypothetical protein
MKSQLWGTTLLGVALLAGQAHASIITINFDDLPNATVIPVGHYTDVNFSSSPGEVIMTWSNNPPYQGSSPNLICTGTTSPQALDCMNDVILTFSVPVSNISFTAYGNQNAPGTSFATADVFQNGNNVTPSQIVSLLVSHTPHTPALCNGTADCVGDPQTLNFSNITELKITNNTDPNGTAYDDFSFTTQSSPTAPEPSTLLLTGFGGLLWVGRRFLARQRG